jgi:hypothetical protein
LSPTPSTSSATKTQENTKVDHDDPEPTDESDIQMKYFSDQLCGSSIGKVTKKLAVRTSVSTGIVK